MYTHTHTHTHIQVGDGRFALWYDSIGMWRLGDVSDVGSTVGRASVESDAFTPIGPHLAPWTVFVWSGWEFCVFFLLWRRVDAARVDFEG